MSNMQGKKGTVAKRGRSWSDANKQGLKARTYLDNIPKGLKLKYGASPRNRVLAVRKTVYPIPDVLVTKLKTTWTQNFQTGASGALATGAFYLNSCNDPSSSVGAYQPRFFDQLMAIYNNYTVYGVKLKVKILGVPASLTRVIFLPSSSVSFPVGSSIYDNGTEFKGTMAFDVAPSGTAAVGDTMGKNTKSFYYDVGEYFGRDQESIMDEANFSGTASSDPATLLYGWYAVQQLAATTQTIISAEISIVQYVSLRGVKMPASST